MLANKQHWGFVDLAFTNNNPPINIDLIEHDAHCLHRSTVGSIFIAPTQPLITCQCGGFSHSGKLDG
ncbi:hypothetical protein YPPY11_0268 [Yersinia pestis PY-11]|nr:hypothetical protein YPPY11_0268 [Yersinia pestis PY-11]